MSVPHKVVVVFDPLFGMRLAELAETEYVWALRSPANEAAAHEYARAAPWEEGEDVLESGISLFQRSELDEKLMEELWDHHGEHSHDPPLSEIVVIGAQPSDLTVAVLSEYGFEIVERRDDGFVALRKK